jgi:PadR family transcriptional regulator PadR
MRTRCKCETQQRQRAQTPALPKPAFPAHGSSVQCDDAADWASHDCSLWAVGTVSQLYSAGAGKGTVKRIHPLLLSQRNCAMLPVGNPKGSAMKEKQDVRQGTLALMVLKTLDVLGPQHGFGIARRIEQISGDLLAVNQGTLYPVLLKLEQEGAVASEWGASENNRRARFYRLTRAGHKQLETETREWEQTAAIIARFFEVKAEDLP